LARRYLDLCRQPAQQHRRKLWQDTHSLIRTMPPIYVRAFAWREMPQSRGRCNDPFFRDVENTLRESLFRSRFEDDFVFEPWLTLSAVHQCTGWGLAGDRHNSDEPHGSFKIDYPIRDLSDVQKLRMPCHQINEQQTAQRLKRLTDAIGDLLPISIDRSPAYTMWTADLSTDLGHLRGIEHLMLDMIDHPQWLHRLMAFLRDGVLAAQTQAERAGDWSLTAHQNQAMPYSHDLPNPAPHVHGIPRRSLWAFAAGQEFTAVGPELWNEFLLTYQKPILESFGLVAYGCCEDLTRKLPYLRTLKNLRRIAVSPFADVTRCTEHIGSDYVISYRPGPADMVSYGFDRNRIESILKRDFEKLNANDCIFDITLKDVETVQSDPHRIVEWVRIVRELTERLFAGREQRKVSNAYPKGDVE
jgi:hypothetical protein